MMRCLSGIRGADLRLCLAVAACIVLFVATPTTPSEDDGCFPASKGTVVVTNRSMSVIQVAFSGPQSHSVTVDVEESASAELKTGQYAWKATAVQNAGSTAGSVTVEKNKTVTITITL